MCPRAGGARHGNEGWRLFLFLWHDSERIHMLRKEDFVPDSLLPWKPIAPSSCSRFSLWAIFGLGPLPPPFDAAASRPTIAPNPTTPDMIRSSGLPAACPAKLSRKLSPPRPTVVRHSRRSVNFIASSYSARNSLPSMRRSVRFVRPSRRRGRDSPGKKRPLQSIRSWRAK